MFERCIYFNGNALVRQLNQIWDETYRQADISAPHAYLLRLAAHQPGMTQQQMAEELRLEKSTVTRFVNQLIEHDWLQRKKGEDGRENRLYVTSAGKRLVSRLDKLGEELYQRMRHKLGAGRFEKLVKDMREVLSELK